jgi:signal transduction histidine kinase
MSTSDVVTVRGLRKSYGTRVVVDGLDLDVPAGEIVGLIGANGAGKTTTVECIQGLRRPDSGQLRVLGFDPVTQAERLRPLVGSQLQQSALPDRLRVAEAPAGAAGITPVHPSPPVAAAGAVVAVGAAALLVLGRRPQLLYAATATAGVAVLTDGRSYNIGWFAVCLLAGWCVLADGRRVGLVYWAGAMILFAAEWLWVQPDPGWGAWLAGVTLTVAFSLLVRHERNLVAQLRAAQAGLAEQARTQERNRIARELHDVIGHTLTVSLLHVQSARLAVEHDPADASRALAEAERLGRECLAEVRTTVGTLRQDGAVHDNAPLPGAGSLPALVEQFRSAGADVSLAVEGDTGGLPATTGLALYRILQEALTNAIRHAPGRRSRSGWRSAPAR